MIIAFSGRRGNGKTAAAKYLEKNYAFKTASFATPLKEMAEQMFPGISKANKEEKFLGFEWTPRQFYIALGGFMRYWDEDYWVNKLLLNLPRGKYVVIDDLRFKNEAKILRSMGTYITRLNRCDKDRPYPYDAEIDNDISETNLNDFTFDETFHEFENNTLKVLHTRLDKLMKDLGVKKIDG